MNKAMQDFIKTKKEMEKKYPEYTFEVDTNAGVLYECPDCKEEINIAMAHDCKREKEILDRGGCPSCEAGLAPHRNCILR